MRTAAAVVLLLCASAAVASPPSPRPRERCPVCGMYVTRQPEWIAALVTEEGQAVFFDGPKDLFKYYLDPQRYERRERFREVWMTEYEAGVLAPARDLVYVVGTRVLGPMGNDLVPVKSESAEAFRREHKGRGVLRFEEVTAEVVRALD